VLFRTKLWLVFVPSDVIENSMNNAISCPSKSDTEKSPSKQQGIASLDCTGPFAAGSFSTAAALTTVAAPEKI